MFQVVYLSSFQVFKAMALVFLQFLNICNSYSRSIKTCFENEAEIYLLPNTNSLSATLLFSIRRIIITINVAQNCYLNSLRIFCKKSFARPAVECSKYPMSVPHKYEAGYKYNMKMDFSSI